MFQHDEWLKPRWSKNAVAVGDCADYHGVSRSAAESATWVFRQYPGMLTLRERSALIVIENVP